MVATGIHFTGTYQGINKNYQMEVKMSLADCSKKREEESSTCSPQTKGEMTMATTNRAIIVLHHRTPWTIFWSRSFYILDIIPRLPRWTWTLCHRLKNGKPFVPIVPDNSGIW
jgi:hypothetical protein